MEVWVSNTKFLHRLFRSNLMNNMIYLYLCLIFTVSGLLCVHHSRGPRVALVEKVLVGQETRRHTEGLLWQAKYQPHLKLTARKSVFVSLLAWDMSIKGKESKSESESRGKSTRGLNWITFSVLLWNWSVFLPLALLSACEIIRNNFPYQQSEITALFGLRTFKRKMLAKIKTAVRKGKLCSN